MAKMKTLDTPLTQPSVAQLRCGRIIISPEGRVDVDRLQAFNLDEDNNVERFPDLDVRGDGGGENGVDLSSCAAEVEALQAKILACYEAEGKAGPGAVADQPAVIVPEPEPEPEPEPIPV